MIKRRDRFPSIEWLREALDYDPHNGIITWRVNKGQRGRIGMVAGSISKFHGYRVIGIDGDLYRASEIAWAIYYGKRPTLLLDHINRKRDDDRIENIREATSAQNCYNSSLYKSNTSGFVGVSFHKASGRFVSRYRENGKLYNLGLFDTAEEASSMYRQAVLYRGVFRPEAS